MSLFDIEADGVDNAISSGDGSHNCVFVVDIGAYRLKRGSFGGTRNPLRMPRGDPSRQVLTEKLAYDAASEKPGSSEHRHNPIGHGRRPFLSCSALAAACPMTRSSTFGRLPCSVLLRRTPSAR
jgi:hypothetical protein